MSAKAGAGFVVYGSKTRPFLPGKIFARNTAYWEGSPLFGCIENLAEASTKLVTLEPVPVAHRCAAEGYRPLADVDRSPVTCVVDGADPGNRNPCCEQASDQTGPKDGETERSDCAVNEIIAWLRELGKIGS
jgi:hypothetical protein